MKLENKIIKKMSVVPGSDLVIHTDALRSALFTHVCSRGPKRCHSNPADSGRRPDRPCGTGT